MKYIILLGLLMHFSEVSVAIPTAATENVADQVQDISIKDGEESAEPFAQILRDEEVTAVKQSETFRKILSKSSSLMQSWLGADECALVTSWGSPSSSYSAPSAKFLTYTYGFDKQYAVDPRDIVPENSRERYSCNMTFKVHDGIIKDYRFDGNYCSTAETGRLAHRPN